MINLILFLINPFIYLVVEIFLLITKKKRPKTKFNDILFLFSLVFLLLYIPYSGGDTIRYAFKYYILQNSTWKESVNIFLPLSDPIYYWTMFLFSFVGLPYNVFIIFVNFLIFLILYQLLKSENENKRKRLILLLYAPLVIYGSRFALSIYFMIFALFKIDEKKYKFILFLIVSFFIHKGASILLIIYIFSFIALKLKLNKKFIAVGIIILGSIFYSFVPYFYSLFPNWYLLEKAFIYKEIEVLKYQNFFTKNSIWYFITLFNMFVAYFSLFFMKDRKNDIFHYFLFFLGSFIISLIGFMMIPSRFSWVFNLIYVIFCVKRKIRINRTFKILSYSYVAINICIVLYYSTYLYIKKTSSFPQIFYPGILQICGYDNQYNKKIEEIAKNYPDKYKVGRKIKVDLDKYYINEE